MWEEERKVSRYAESLPQLEARRKISPNPKVGGDVWGDVIECAHFTEIIPGSCPPAPSCIGLAL